MSTFNTTKDLDDIKAHARLCFQCGVCMGGCPVARVNDRFHPRRLVRELAMGDLEGVLRGDAIWLCAQCHICSETCPQGIGISNLIIGLRNFAIDMGVLPPESFVKNMKQLVETGRLVPPSSRIEQLRDRLGLGPIEQAAVEEVQHLITNTKFKELMTNNR
jgi:heterodisulfide reductase subunit C